MGIDNPLTWISIFAIQILGSIVLTLIFDYIFKDKLKLYSKEDLILE